MKKWSELDIFYKSLFVSTLYSIFFILISLILLINSTSWIYGALLGIGIMYIGWLLSWIIYYVIPENKGQPSVGMTLLNWISRVFLFIIVFVIIIFLANSSFANRDKFSFKNITNPINTLSMLASYSLIPLLSYFTIPIMDSIIYRKIRR